MALVTTRDLTRPIHIDVNASYSIEIVPCFARYFSRIIASAEAPVPALCPSRARKSISPMYMLPAELLP